MRVLWISVICLFATVASAQCTGSGPGTGSGPVQLQCGQSAPMVIGTENFYCPKGTAPEYIEQLFPIWSPTDDGATLPTVCIYTGTDGTPSPGNIYTPVSISTLNNVIASVGAGPAVNPDGSLGGSGHLSCGDTVVVTSGTTYTAVSEWPALACDGLHWITVRASKAGGLTLDPNFPQEGVRITPCAAGIYNDSIHGRNAPGYPDYPCPSFGTVLTAKFLQAANDNASAASFASSTLAQANHYRFIGIEFAQSPTNSTAKIIKLALDGTTPGGNHIIFDRSLIHGIPWTPTTGVTAESTQGVAAKNAQWVAVVNSWIYDTYCNSSCIDSQAFACGAGLIQDGPFKVYNILASTAGESVFCGGGGQGAGTPNTMNMEIRSNYMFKPLHWMVPIDQCAFYRDPVTKNLFEMKSAVQFLIEGNVLDNAWQGCQSDQNGTAFKLNPSNQNNHQQMRVTYDGSNVAQAALQCTGGTNAGNSCTVNTDCPLPVSGFSTCAKLSFTHHTATSPTSGNPIDSANCPPSGCVLADIANNIDHRFCNSLNGCDQSGVPNLQCGTGVNAGLACTVDAQCPGSYCAPTTSARLTCGLTALGQEACPAASPSVNTNACVPGDCPTCRNQDITVRYNEIYNATGGISINTGLSSICHDQAAGMKNVSIHDNRLLALSREMVNGVDPYSDATCFSLSNNSLPPSVIGFIGIRHNTCAVETAVTATGASSTGSFGNQIDHSDIQYLQSLSISDNVAPGGWAITRSAGTVVNKGIGGASGLANTFAVNSCQRYFTSQAPIGTIVTAGTQNFTFAGLPGAGTNYLVSLNGQYTALAASPAPTSTSFTVTAATHVNDTIVVRDLNDCAWTFRSNLVGVGQSGTVGISPNFFGAGAYAPPYPNFVNGVTVAYACGSGGSAPCVLDENVTPGSFIGNFAAWGTGRNGDFSIASSSAYYQTASDSASRASTGQSPGADMTVIGTKTQGVRGTVPVCGAGYVAVQTTCMPILTIATSSLPSGTHGTAYNAALVASAGASQFWLGYKSWWLETTSTLCGGACGTLGASGLVIGRDGTVNGPFAILNISRSGCPATCLSNYTVKETITGGGWAIGQVATMAQFLNSGTCDSTHTANCDGSFTGTCTISAIATNQFSCPMTNGINFNISSHMPNGPIGPANGCGLTANAQCPSTASFAPLSGGSFPQTYTFWVGARDGAFQVTRKQITAIIN